MAFEDPSCPSTSLFAQNNGLFFFGWCANRGKNNSRLGAMQHVQSEDHTWTSRTLKSALRRGVTPFTPAGSWNFFIYLNSRGYYVMPLMISSLFFCSPRGCPSASRCALEQGGR